jgi:uncharacterized protein (DUF362 family)
MNPLPTPGCPGLSRRNFLRLAAAAALTAAVPARAARAAAAPSKTAGVKRVALAGVARGIGEAGLRAAVRQAAEAATGFSWLSRGDTVLVKPVVNSGNPYPATTSPPGLSQVISLLKEKGAKRVIVSDMAGIEHLKLTPGSLRGSTRKLMQSCGLARAALEAGAELYFPEEDGWGAFFEDGPASGSRWKAGIMMPRIIREVDHVVLLPRCGRHALAGATLGMKAAVGYWRTDSRLEYHHDAATFHEKTADANTVESLAARQRLTLTVADKVLATFGPDKGFVAAPDTGLILASESLVAHDMLALAWLLETRRAVPEDEKQGLRDPNTSGAIVGLANRWVVSRLGGITDALTAEPLERNDLDTIWDDRVLMRAFEVFGGRPALDLVEANAGVSAELKRRLAGMTSAP